MDDNQESGLGKVGIDWGVNNDGDESLIGERQRKEREQLILSPRRCERIECVEIFHDEMTGCRKGISDTREYGLCVCVLMTEEEDIFQMKGRNQ